MYAASRVKRTQFETNLKNEVIEVCNYKESSLAIAVATQV
jgi:hypothetical protein